MEELLLLLKTAPAQALAKLREQQKNPGEIQNYIKEYEELDRNQRQTQVGMVQEDRTVNGKIVNAVKIPIDYAGKIVDTSVAFEYGEPVTLIPQVAGDKKSNLAEVILRTWKVRRIDNFIQKALKLKKSQTQSAIVFYIADVVEGSVMQKVFAFLGITNQQKEIKATLLDNKKGVMSPYFDAYGDLKAFVWDFSVKLSNGQEEKHSWVYTDTSIFKSINEKVPVEEKHGFSKMPIAYFAQEKPEYYKVQPLIDRQEVSLSKLCDSNDRTAHPLLKIFGEVVSFPDKNDNGKVLNFPMKIDRETKKEFHGDAEFLTNDNAPASAKLELETNENLISYISSTPILSLNQLKGIGNVAEKTVKLMFLDAIIKAKGNEGDNRTMVERIINILISGIVTSTNTKLKNEAEQLFFDIQFNSVLPGDLKEAADIASVLKNAGLISTKTAVEYLDMAEDVGEELAAIEKDIAASEPQKQLDPAV